MRYLTAVLLAAVLTGCLLASAGAQENADPRHISNEITKGTLGLLIGTQRAPVKVRVTRCWDPPNLWRSCHVIATGTSSCRMVLEIRRAGRNFHGTARRLRCES